MYTYTPTVAQIFGDFQHISLPILLAGGLQIQFCFYAGGTITVCDDVFQNFSSIRNSSCVLNTSPLKGWNAMHIPSWYLLAQGDQQKD